MINSLKPIKPISFVAKSLCLLTLNFSLVATVFVSQNAQAEPCEIKEFKWISSRYYAGDDIVFYEGNWYKSLYRHFGMQPDLGGTWTKLKGVPPCAELAEEAGVEVKPEEAPKKKNTRSHYVPKEVTEKRLEPKPKTEPNPQVVLPSTEEQTTDEKITKAIDKSPENTIEVTEKLENTGETTGEKPPVTSTPSTELSEDAKEVLSRVKELAVIEEQEKQREERKNTINCSSVKAWSPAVTYYTSDHVIHEGKYYLAIRNSFGKFPGVFSPPPAWKPVELDCNE